MSITREEALTRDGTLPHSREVLINEIFDEHEAQIKAKDEKLEELGEIIQQYLIPSKNYEAEIRAKDEEIARLEQQIGFADIYISELEKQDAKARSIVAMLFWEWRKANTSYANSRTEKPKPSEKTISLRGMRASQCERLFKQSYKMLKKERNEIN